MKPLINENGTPCLHVSVTELVCFVLRNGDIGGFSGENTLSRMKEGKEIHRKFQREAAEKHESFVAESRLCASVPLSGYEIYVTGFADGIALEGDTYRVFEIKSVRGRIPPGIISPLHLAQAMCYGYMLAKSKNESRVGVSLVYVSAEKDDIEYRDGEYGTDELERQFFDLISRFAPFAEKMLSRLFAVKSGELKIRFPYGSFREGQKELISEIYSAGKKGYSVFASAPTGIGKTISALYPAVKLLENGYMEKVFYITPKNSIKKQISETVSLIQGKTPFLRSIIIASKSFLCDFDECVASDAGGDVCAKAKGHFDRINGALYELLSGDMRITEEDVQRCASKHGVCPFELSLDAALFCDVIICDYNYIFDPDVALKRFDMKHEYMLITDEAHNLPERVRENYSASLDPRDLSYFIRYAKEVSVPVCAAAKETVACLKRIKAEADKDGNFISFRQDDLLTASVRKLFEALRRYMSDNFFYDRTSPANNAEDHAPGTNGFPIMFREAEEKGAAPQTVRIPAKETDFDGELDERRVRDMFFACRSFLKASERFDNSGSGKKEYAFICGESGEVKLYLVDPAVTIGAISSQFGSSVYFSATLLPQSYYLTLLGGSENDVFINIPSPFPEENKLIAAVNISVKYSDRARTAPALADMIHRFFSIKPGNYIVFFPSFDYLETVMRFYKGAFPSDRIIAQKRYMTKKDRDDFVMSFRQITISDSPLIGFAVLGGIFSEGIDLKGNALLGTMIVGVGLAPPSPESEAQCLLYDDRGQSGKNLSYDMPGLNRVFQAAGRVIRSEDDRGIIILADNRYFDENLKDEFPSDWNVEYHESAAELAESIRDFWEQ